MKDIIWMKCSATQLVESPKYELLVEQLLFTTVVTLKTLVWFFQSASAAATKCSGDGGRQILF